MTRFELATPRPPDVCATGLRYIPKNFRANLIPFGIKKWTTKHFNQPGIQTKDLLVGMTGFEPAASSSRTKRATGLRYIPLLNIYIN
jgi:hypothetical protein